VNEVHSQAGKRIVAEQLPEETHTKRRAILDAARDLFTGKGYEETTIADIARAAHIAVGTVYLYFRNKHDIYTAVALDIEALIANSFQDMVLADLPFEQVPRAMLEAVFRVSREHMSMVSLLQIDMQTQEEIQLHKHSTEMITKALAVVLQTAVERGQLAPFNTEMYALLLNLLGGAVMHQCFGVEHGEREELYQQYTLELLERLFFGPSLRKGSE
jgi:AcrR family transcriptional regulator